MPWRFGIVGRNGYNSGLLGDGFRLLGDRFRLRGDGFMFRAVGFTQTDVRFRLRVPP
jgi:hypothetical protein